jgi:hypothetical protein
MKTLSEILQGIDDLPAFAKKAGVSLKTLRRLASGASRCPTAKTAGLLRAAISEPFSHESRPARRDDLNGRRFGRLTVEEFSHIECGGAVWACRCDCGKMSVIPARLLKSGNTASCGCGATTAPEHVARLRVAREADSHDGTQPSHLSDKPRKDNRSGRRGVYWHPRRRQWQAYIMLRGKQQHLGWFDEFSDAVKAREEAEEKFFAPILEDIRAKKGKGE